MTVDKKEHRDFLLRILATASIPGQLIDLAHDVKQALQTAKVEPAALVVDAPPAA